MTDKKWQVDIAIGLLVPGYFQGTALFLEGEPAFKKCVVDEIDKYFYDGGRFTEAVNLLVDPTGGEDWRKDFGDENPSYFEVHRYLVHKLNSKRKGDAEVTAQPQPAEAGCTPSSDGGWIKTQSYRLEWVDQGRPWRCADVVVAFEEDRSQRVYGDWLRSKLCGLELAAFVRVTPLP